MVWAIGDVHGCVEALRKLLDEVSPSEYDKLIFLGDYIDRGPDSKAVVELLIELSKKHKCVFIRGNHEQMLLDVLDGGEDPYLWLINGAQATWRSYGTLEALKNDQTHLDFFRSTVYYHIESVDGIDYLFVHGGVRPRIPLEQQNPQDLLWIREEFILKRHHLPYIVVFGHTPMEDVFIAEDKIGIDTGCVYGGKLTAFCVNNGKKVQVSCGRAW
ncbi:metallophosphoesterase family protein [Fervidobacterium thailandense]|uniref:Metallophosphatase n=1 Tax=Fervidobacterium thailandense TaxID=1008305 RepID=A0A1E3G509_9BACT|nr:metallophosphoesterase family protein [Fervidobacterium thailandense]ODN31220.1 metallophosphatase [Fervidobacterium thailandense]